MSSFVKVQNLEMKSTMFPFSWLQLFSVTILALAVSSAGFKIPRLSPIRKTLLRHPEIFSPPIPEDFQTFYYNQTLDHFNYRHESYTKFRQRYVMSSKYWGGPNSPIFAYLGAEAPIDGDIADIGFFSDNAQSFKALQVYIEHRYYGESYPFGSREEAMKNASTRGYFNSAQALADYAEILLHIKKELHAQHSPVIVVGGSYGGMLAAWFRLKYPHVAVGALASSAPILYFDNITLSPPGGYISVVTNDFREASETCYQTILDSWSEFDKVAAKSNGLAILSQKFNTCKPLNNTTELKNFLEDVYAGAAQYDEPPWYPVNMICDGIDGANSTKDDIISKISAGVFAYLDVFAPESCYVNNPPEPPSETDEGWSWQSCSEMVIPIGVGNDTIFPYGHFDLRSFEAGCKKQYGVSPRPNWVTSYYGGQDIKLILRRFGSNIIFSNGLRDPYSSGGVLENLSESLLAVVTKNGSHCLDILLSSDSDPDWLVEQRVKEVKIVRNWLHKYYIDLRALIQK